MNGTEAADRKPILLSELETLIEVVRKDGRHSSSSAAAPRLPVDLNDAVVRYWSAGTTVRWNEIARELAAESRYQPTEFTLVTALVSGAQYDAALAASAANGSKPHGQVRAAISAASSGVLQSLFPASKDRIAAWESGHATLLLKQNAGSDADFASALGRKVAEVYKDYKERHLLPAESAAPTQESGAWAAGKPVTPGWGGLKSWFVRDKSKLMPKPPPAPESPEFRRACDEVVDTMSKASVEDFRMAMRWGDGVGTFTPAGHWNTTAALELEENPKSEFESASILAALNLALMDAGILCWACKYKYWLPRPSDVDSRIKPLMMNPLFPSYVSGHATFSNTAAEVLGAICPQKAKYYKEQAAEATRSRLVAGIHFGFDCDEGAALGVKIGKIALKECIALGILKENG